MGGVTFFDKEKLLKAREVILKIANGIDPINKEHISPESFLNNPRVLRCFFFIAEVLDDVSRKKDKNIPQPAEFIITPEEKKKVILPEGKIGVNAFSKCINEVIDLNRSKKLSGVALNKQLKKLGILDEEKLENGKTRTIISNNSSQFGFESKKQEYEGRIYKMVVINDKGKKYLIDNLTDIMKYGENEE